MRLLGVPGSTFDRFRAEGMPVGVDGRYDLAAIVAWMRSTWLDSRRAAAGARSGEEELARYRAVRTSREQLRLDAERGDLVARDDVAAEWRNRIMTVRARLLALPRTIAGRCAHAPADLIDLEASSIIRDLLLDFAAGGDLTPSPEDLKDNNTPGRTAPTDVARGTSHITTED